MSTPPEKAITPDQYAQYMKTFYPQIFTQGEKTDEPTSLPAPLKFPSQFAPKQAPTRQNISYEDISSSTKDTNHIPVNSKLGKAKLHTNPQIPMSSKESKRPDNPAISIEAVSAEIPVTMDQTTQEWIRQRKQRHPCNANKDNLVGKVIMNDDKISQIEKGDAEEAETVGESTSNPAPEDFNSGSVPIVNNQTKPLESAPSKTRKCKYWSRNGSCKNDNPSKRQKSNGDKDSHPLLAFPNLAKMDEERRLLLLLRTFVCLLGDKNQ